MTPADPKTSTTASAVQEAKRGPRRAARAKVDYTLTERHRAAVERLEQLADDIVGRLDLIDRDPDLEDGADEEMWLGAPEPQGGYVQRGYGRMDQRRWADGGNNDREEDTDYEPSLGSIGSTASANSFPQTYWNAPGADCTDLEKADDDNEGSLGWCEGLDQSHLGSSSDEAEYDLGAANPSGRNDQTHWGERNAGWGGGDAEEQCEDEGAQCEDEGGACEDEGAATGDDEGDAQAPCHSSADPARPWPPLGSASWTVERPYG